MSDEIREKAIEAARNAFIQNELGFVPVCEMKEPERQSWRAAIDAYEKALPQPTSALNFRPLREAPHDGTAIVLAYIWEALDGTKRIGWIADGWVDDNGTWKIASFDVDEDDYSPPTHFIPLPVPPEVT